MELHANVSKRGEGREGKGGKGGEGREGEEDERSKFGRKVDQELYAHVLFSHDLQAGSTDSVRWPYDV